MTRAPRSVFYDGALYARLVEPMLFGMHGFVAANAPPGERVLEACCGTGALARKLAADGRRVVGVDLSPRNIAYANDVGGPRERLAYEVGDVSQLVLPPEGPYDVATIVLALHEMPAGARQGVLAALLAVATRVMVVDFAVPMPRNFAGLRNRVMEVAAGFEHFAAFRDFNRRGGLSALFEAVGANVESERRIDAGTIHVAVLRAAHDAAPDE